MDIFTDPDWGNSQEFSYYEGSSSSFTSSSKFSVSSGVLDNSLHHVTNKNNKNKSTTKRKLSNEDGENQNSIKKKKNEENAEKKNNLKKSVAEKNVTSNDTIVGDKNTPKSLKNVKDNKKIKNKINNKVVEKVKDNVNEDKLDDIGSSKEDKSILNNKEVVERANGKSKKKKKNNSKRNKYKELDIKRKLNTNSSLIKADSSNKAIENPDSSKGPDNNVKLIINNTGNEVQKDETELNKETSGNENAINNNEIVNSKEKKKGKKVKEIVGKNDKTKKGKKKMEKPSQLSTTSKCVEDLNSETTKEKAENNSKKKSKKKKKKKAGNKNKDGDEKVDEGLQNDVQQFLKELDIDNVLSKNMDCDTDFSEEGDSGTKDDKNAQDIQNVKNKKKKKKKNKKVNGTDLVLNGIIENKDDKKQNSEDIQNIAKKEKKKKKKKGNNIDVDLNSNTENKDDEKKNFDKSSDDVQNITKKEKKKKKKKGNNTDVNLNSNTENKDENQNSSKFDSNVLNRMFEEADKTPKKLSAVDALREKMTNQLNAAQFRLVNEKMYTTTSSASVKMFKSDPKSFDIYHKGFQSQVALWPVNPLDLIIKWFKNKPKTWVVADLGCGEAILAKSVPQVKVHSIDLVALNPRVTVGDMAHTKLNAGSVDAVVFCLSLMGTNIKDFIMEANRILREGGILKIAEVESRFIDVNHFVGHVKKFGFHLTYSDTSMKFFFMFEFKKHRNLKVADTLPNINLKACKYKKR